MPSMPILMTPTRSHITPLRAPNVIGTLLRTESCSIPTRLKDLPAAAQPRNVKANRMRATTSTTLAALPNPRLSWMAPRKARKAETM